MGVKRFYISPLAEEAAGQMFMAERFFDRDSFDLALNGYGTYPGFLEVIDDYGITKSANLAKYYAGVSYLSLKNNEKAIEYLNDFNTKDILLGSAKFSSLGDAYTNLADYESAIKAYTKGADKYKNDFSTPVILKKLGFVYEESGKYAKAVDTYKSIAESFPESSEARDIEKYIARAELKSK
jgi:tetratricopeptide (TPR) repeat protein